MVGGQAPHVKINTDFAKIWFEKKYNIFNVKKKVDTKMQKRGWWWQFAIQSRHICGRRHILLVTGSETQGSLLANMAVMFCDSEVAIPPGEEQNSRTQSWALTHSWTF
jgi:hypothetical protein